MLNTRTKPILLIFGLFFLREIQGLDPGNSPQLISGDQTRYSQWILGVNMGTGFGAYSKDPVNNFVPLSVSMDVGFNQFRLLFGGLFGWTGTNDSLLLGNQLIPAKTSSMVMESILSFGYTMWFSEHFSITPTMGFGYGFIRLQAPSGTGPIDAPHKILPVGMNLTYSFPVSTPKEAQHVRFNTRSIFVRLRLAYSLAPFEREEGSLKGDLFSATVSLGMYFGTKPTE